MATLTINGVAQPIRGGTLRIRESVNARGTIAFEVPSFNGTRPPASGELIYTDGADRLFGGIVDNPTERGMVSQLGLRIINGVNALDFNALADYRHINGIIMATTLKAALEEIVTYLETYDVTLDPFQVTGPMIPTLTLPVRRIRDVLDDLSLMTGYVWEIDYHRVLRMFLPGTIAAPFNVAPNTDPSVIDGDITVDTVRSGVNRIILVAGSGLRESAQTFTGDGVTRVFVLLVIVATLPVVTINDVPVTVGTYGVDTHLEWVYRSADNSITQLAEAPTGTAHSPLTGADVLEARYTGQLPFIVFADHAGEQATHGIREEVFEEPNTLEEAAARTLADAYLNRAITTFHKVRYVTRRRGIHAGQTQTITVPQRNLSGTFLVTDAEHYDTVDQHFATIVTAVGGTVFPGSWRDFYRQGGGARSGGSPSPVVGTGGGGTQVVLSSPVSLGGSRHISVAITPATWLPVRDYRPFLAQGTFAGRVRADTWALAAGVSATLRLVAQASGGAWTEVAATSTPVTSQTAVTVMFNVGIVTGKLYRLEVLASAAGAGVFGIGDLESA